MLGRIRSLLRSGVDSLPSDSNNPPLAPAVKTPSPLLRVGNSTIETYFRRLLAGEQLRIENQSVDSAESQCRTDDIVEEAVCLARLHSGNHIPSRKHAALETGRSGA